MPRDDNRTKRVLRLMPSPSMSRPNAPKPRLPTTIMSHVHFDKFEPSSGAKNFPIAMIYAPSVKLLFSRPRSLACLSRAR